MALDRTENRLKALERPQCAADYAFMACVYLIALIALLAVGYPLWNVVVNSISEPTAIYQGKVFLWPVKPTLEAYDTVYRYPSIWLGYRNSLFYALFGTLINLVVTTLAAFPLSRRDLGGRRAFTLVFTFTMFFSGGLVPTYMVVMRLNMLDTPWALLIPGAMSVWNMIIMRTFFQTTIPEELYEATLLDGGNDFVFLTRVVLPLSKAILAVMALYYAVGHWNAYFNALIYLNDNRLYPLQVFLRRILVLNEIDVEIMGTLDVRETAAMQRRAELMKYALIIVSSLPVMILYPLVQKYFVQGVMVGSIKG
jgi:multiple sugar transport system permease protein/putative aldouronate transport system permease protein